MSKKLVSVYGSLRQGLHNHKYHLENAEYLGTFSTEPEYTLHSLSSFPGLKENGNTSVVMEVYEVTDEEDKSIERLEGYSKGGNNTFYDKKEIQTPWGLASTYIYINDLPSSTIVESGDWKEFKNNVLDYYSVSNN